MTEDFDAQEYWEKRLGERYDFSGVGWESLGKPYNRWTYWAKRKIFNRIIENLRLPLEEFSVLDIGSGTGFYVERWKEIGISDINGCDITAMAVENLQNKYPEFRFEQADIGAEIDQHRFASEQYDIVSCFDVLYHIVDDSSFQQAITNIAKLVKPAGLFILTDYFFRYRGFRSKHVVGRPMKEYTALLQKCGFRVLERRPASVVCFPPSDVKNQFWSILWYAVTIPVRLLPILGYAYGMILAPADVLLTKAFHEGPGLEFMICRREEHLHTNPSNEPVGPGNQK